MSNCDFVAGRSLIDLAASRLALRAPRATRGFALDPTKSIRAVGGSSGRDALPTVKVVGPNDVITNHGIEHGAEIGVVQAAAGALESDVAAAFTTLIERRVSALLVDSTQPTKSFRSPRAIQFRRCSTSPGGVGTGGLIGYGHDLSETYRQVGIYAGRILKGEKPENLPEQRPTRFKLMINLGTAKALGLTVPPNLLALADAVIE